MRRRDVLATLAASATAGASGCAGFLGLWEPTLAWERAVGDVVAIEPTEQVVVVAGTNRVLGLDPDDGAVRWTHDADGTEGVLRDGDRCYVYGQHGVLAVTLPDGAADWHLDRPAGRVQDAGPGLLVYAYRPWEWFGVDPATGDVRWERSGETPLLVGGDLGLVHEEEVVAVDLVDGTTRWRLGEDGTTRPVVADEDRIVVGREGEETSVLSGVDRSSGERRWRVPAGPGEFDYGGAHDDVVYVAHERADGQRTLYAVADDAGGDHWTAAIDHDDGARPVGAVDGTVLLARYWNRTLPTVCGVDPAEREVSWCRADHGLVATSDELAVFSVGEGELVGRRPDGSAAWSESMHLVPKVGGPFTDGLVYRPPDVAATGDYVVATFAGTNVLEVWTVEGRSHRLNTPDTVDEVAAGGGTGYAFGSGTLHAVSLP